MMKKCSRLICPLLLGFHLICAGQNLINGSMGERSIASKDSGTNEFIRTLLGQYPAYFDSLLNNNDQYRIQIIYTQIDRGANGMPKLTHHYFNQRPDLYFYPASTVKLPAAILALQKLNELSLPGLNKNTTMITEAADTVQTAVFNDPSAGDGRPTIAHYIKKIFLVSDNDAYNRLYEFLGQEYLNTILQGLGYKSAQLLHRLQLPLTEAQNRLTNPIKFYDSSAKSIYEQKVQQSKLAYEQRHHLLGRGYLSGNKLVEEPFDFSKKNKVSLQDLHTILQSIILPETVRSSKRFKLTDDDYSFLYKHLSMLPSESSFPQYDSTYNDAYVKFLLFGGKGNIENKNIRIFNKVGDAYGFLQDVAYIVDFENNVEFFVSATIYCNSDGVFNDDTYEYETVGFPFLKHLGEVLYHHELKRPKKYLPDLTKFKFNYKDDLN